MSRVLLDTHAFLWFVFRDRRLSKKAARTISATGTTKMLSMASVWEIVIKTQLGKLGLGMGIEEFLDRYVSGRQIEVLPIELPDLVAYSSLPMHHSDPFDRLLIAQSQLEDAYLATGDPQFLPYDVDIVWSAAGKPPSALHGRPRRRWGRRKSAGAK